MAEKEIEANPESEADAGDDPKPEADADQPSLRERLLPGIRDHAKGTGAWIRKRILTDLDTINLIGVFIALLGAVLVMLGSWLGDGLVSPLGYISLVLLLYGAFIHKLVTEAESHFETIPNVTSNYIGIISAAGGFVAAAKIYQVGFIGTTISTQSTLKMVTVVGASILGLSVFVIALGEAARRWDPE